jgi:putative tryptophan/tyrosine transport system substrate-binding protein
MRGGCLRCGTGRGKRQTDWVLQAGFKRNPGAGFEAAFATLAKNRATVLVVGGFPLFSHRRDKLLPLPARYKVPAIYPSRDFVLDGGLISYGGNYDDAFRLGGNYIGQILKGAKPADLLVQQATIVAVSAVD